MSVTLRSEGVKGIKDGTMRKNLRRAQSLGIRDGLAHLEDVHKNKVIRRGSGPTVSGVWTSRRGAAGLSGSFGVNFKMGELQGSYGSDSFISEVQEKGKTIRAKNAPYLRFKVEGNWVAVKRVVLPPRPTLEKAMKMSERGRMKLMSRHVDKALAKD